MSRSMLRSQLRSWLCSQVTSPVRRSRSRRHGGKLQFEALETRALLTTTGDFLALQTQLKDFLSDISAVGGALDTVVEASQAKLPIIDQSLGELVGVDTAIDDFKAAADSIIAGIDTALNPDNFEEYAENLLNQYLGSGPDGIDILDNPANVTLPLNADDPLLKVELDIKKSLESSPFTFGLGLSSIPFGKVSAEGTFTFEVGLEIPSLEFGLDTDGAFFVENFVVQLDANVTLEDPALSAELGFLHVGVVENPAAPGEDPNHPEEAYGNQLKATFGVQINTNDLTNIVVAAPVLVGSANIDIIITGDFPDAQIAAPSVDANFVLHWQFLNSGAQQTDSNFGSNLTAVFKDVRVNLGTYLSDMLGASVEKIQQLVDPFKDFFELMDEPIPVISDIAKVVGDNDGVSLLDVATILQSTGTIPPDYAALVTLAKTVIEITNVINTIETEQAGALDSLYIEMGDFDLIGNQGNPNDPNYQDVRDVDPANDAGFGNDVTDINWSNLNSIAAAIDLDAIKAQLETHLGDLGTLLGDALDDLKQAASGGPNFASINLSFPLTDNPTEAIFGLLMGKDTDLVSFEADAHLDVSGDLPVFSYQGFEISLYGSLTLDAHLKMAYDTYGLRNIVLDYFTPPDGGVTGEMIGLNLLDGLYLDPTTHFDLGVSIGINGGANYELLQAHVAGRLDAEVHVIIPPGTDTGDIPDGRIRPSEFTENLFQINGSLSGALDFTVKVGVDPLSWSETLTIADGEIASFKIGGVNPFAPADILALATLDDNTHQLTLNMGSHAADRHLKDNILDEPIDEKYIITHSEPRTGDPNFGEAVNVTAFGFTQRYTGVTSIFADGELGNDKVDIAAEVHATVNLFGGSGNDVFMANGSGLAMLDGGVDNDRLTGGIGVHTLLGGGGNDILSAGEGNAEIHGGDGDDTILGGAGINLLYGDGNKDFITGGTGPNTIFGGAGDDHLVAGSQNGDTLYGDGGNDLIEAGKGFGNLFGDAGNDQFVWEFVDPDAGISQSDGGANIDGGAGNDQIMLFGGPAADVFSVSKIVGNPQFKVQVAAPFAGEGGFFAFTSIKLKDVEDIDVEAGAGADQITINELTDTRVVNVGVNLTDLVEDYYGIGDGVVDHVIVNGTQAADNVTIKGQYVVIQEPAMHGSDPLFGGLTTISGLPQYTVRVANVEDDLLFNARDGSDTINVQGITGPTLVRGNGNASPLGSDDDRFNVSALTTNNYATELNIDADGGVNAIHVSQPGGLADTFAFTQERIESNLLHAVNFVATGGDFTGGVTLTTGQAGDTVNVRNTLPGVHTIVETGKSDDTVNVGSLSGNLAAILGILSIDTGEGADNTLRVSDTNSAIGNQNVLIGFDTIHGLAGLADTTPIDFHATGGTLGLWIEGSNSAGLAERFVVNGPHAVLRLTAQGGNDKIDVIALSQLTLLEGGQGNDTINLGYLHNKLGTIQASVYAVGGGGFDTVNALDSLAAPGQTYVLGVNVLNRSGAAPVGFDGSLEVLNLNTTDFDDQVFVQAQPVANTTSINARQGNDRLTGPNANTNWLVTDTNKGSLGSNVLFAGVENLQGGTANDQFALASGKGVTGTINGGGAYDTLDYSGYASAVVINLQTKTAPNILGGWDQFEKFVGGAEADQLIGPNLPNIWKLHKTDGGQINTLAMGMLDFSGIEHLQGGTSNDGFQFMPAGHVSGNINGQAGTDTLDYGQLPVAMPVRVNLSIGNASRVGGSVAGIEHAAGGAGNDILVGNALANVLSGNGGRDILIGREGFDILNGGLDDDILIGGTTQFDSDVNAIALNAIMNEWSSNQSYAVRRQHLLGQLGGGLNGTYKLTNSTVLNDLADDQLVGGAGTDWFWANAFEILGLDGVLGEKIGAN